MAVDVIENGKALSTVVIGLPEFCLDTSFHTSINLPHGFLTTAFPFLEYTVPT